MIVVGYGLRGMYHQHFGLFLREKIRSRKAKTPNKITVFPLHHHHVDFNSTRLLFASNRDVIYRAVVSLERKMYNPRTVISVKVSENSIFQRWRSSSQAHYYKGRSVESKSSFVVKCASSRWTTLVGTMPSHFRDFVSPTTWGIFTPCTTFDTCNEVYFTQYILSVAKIGRRQNSVEIS